MNDAINPVGNVMVKQQIHDPFEAAVPGMGPDMTDPAAAPVGPTDNLMLDQALKDIPDQSGLMGTGRGAGLGELMLEDYFPKLDISEDAEEDIIAWFKRDLRSCVKNVEAIRWDWAKYRAVYLLEYVEKFYPDMGIGADYCSGLLCDQMLEGMARMKKSIFAAYPFFGPDTKQTGTDLDIEYVLRAQWCLHTMLDKELKVTDVIGDAGIFDFLMDGSLIMEADTVFEKVPQRMLKTYTDMEALVADQGNALTDAYFNKAMGDLQSRGIARMLVEQDVVTKNGLQVFWVDKVDHLVPQGVWSDRDIRFRARRMYLTTSDLRLLASDGVGWYDKDVVEEIVDSRVQTRNNKSMASDPKFKSAAMERVRNLTENYDLSYQWQEEDEELGVRPGSQPYEDVFAVYRITCKYGYKTKSDPEGLIPKYCLFDYSPEGDCILRAVAYPHFKDKPNWFHFKLGYAPRSYYGFGFGRRLMQDDFLESNAVDLYMDASALASFNPFLCKHPEAGGRIPFTSGYGPAKVGYLNDMSDFKQIDSPEPSQALIRNIVPMIRSRVEGRTGITSLVQGRTESSDPRSPAQKTAMLLNQANISLEEMIHDWNRTGWEPLAKFVWSGMYELAVCILDAGGEITETLGGLIVKDATSLGPEVSNKITLEELGKDLDWKSLASTDYLNPATRMSRFMQMANIFLPLLNQVAQVNPDVYKKYFIRWMRRAAQELDLTGISFLIPTEKEMMQLGPQQMAQMLQGLMSNMRATTSQSGQITQGDGGAQPPPQPAQ